MTTAPERLVVVQDQSTNNGHLGVERDGRWFAACSSRYKVSVLPEDYGWTWISCQRCMDKAGIAFVNGQWVRRGDGA